jgi:hypothetical protein
METNHKDVKGDRREIMSAYLKIHPMFPLNSNRPGHDFSFITFIAVVPMGRNVERNVTGFFGTFILRTQASAVLGSLSPSAFTA